MRNAVFMSAGAAMLVVVVSAGGAQAAAPAWRQVKSPALPDGGSLQSIAALSKKDAWAVGTRLYRDGSVFLHWDGKSWSTPRSTAAVTGRIEGYDQGAKHLTVAGSSPSDVWVAGNRAADAERRKPITAHWDGKKWRAGNVPTTGELFAVTSAGAKDVWAVGQQNGRPLVVHWNGKKWSVAKVSAVQGKLQAVAVLPKGKLWAVGTVTTTARGTILRSDGGAWRSVPLPTQVPEWVLLNAITGDGAGGVWLGMQGGPGRKKAWYAHWNEKSKRWDIANGAYTEPTNETPQTYGLSLVPGTRTVWSVNTARTSFIERYS